MSVEKMPKEKKSRDSSPDEISQSNLAPADHEKAVPRTTLYPPDAATAVPVVDAKEKDPFAHLPDHEAAVLRRQVDLPTVHVTYMRLFRYATNRDLLILFVSCICAIIAGAAMPLMTIIFGGLAGEFQGFFLGTTSGTHFADTVSHLTLYFVYLAVGEFVTSYIATVGTIHVGEHLSGKIRQHYLAGILRQNMAYFDRLGAGEITTRITSDTNLVQDGISEKLGLLLTAVATFIAAYVIGYIKYWKLTLILTSSVAAMCLTMATLGQFIVKANKKSLAAYAEGGTVAEEVISSIRNTIAFGTQTKLAEQYRKHLAGAEKSGFVMKAIMGSILGFMMCYVYLTYALAFWLGSKYIVSGDCTLSDVLTIILSIMIGSFSLGNAAPNIQAMSTAIAAAGKIFATIDRISPLDPTSDQGRKLDRLNGVVELRHVKHIYPSRPEVVVMNDVSLVIPAGKTTALVGASGSGKSTIVGLVERFYEPVGGDIFLDGVPVRDLNLGWLRQQISLVSQEPTLFATTISDNIRHGLIGTKYEDESDTVTRDLIENAAKIANAHNFITALPEGYNTHVGERGFLLSGGQKQRIAIARAIVSDPKILLLDEATSALDTKSEGVVQAALDKAAQGRTTIAIAHRLSTIRDADNIVVMSHGEIVEQGTHNELLEKKSAYYSLVEAQRIAAETERSREEEEDSADEDERKNGLHRAPTEKLEEHEVIFPIGRSQSGQSSSSKALERRKQDSPSFSQKYSLWTLIKLIASFNRSEAFYMVMGLFAAIICGAGNPVQAILFSKSITALSLPPSRYHELRSSANFWSWMYFMLALAQLIAYLVQGIAFAFCSERLVYRARDISFRTMLRQDVAFFDREENAAGALTTFLSTQTTHMAGLSGSTLGILLLVSTTLVLSFVLALSIGWKLALVCICTVPIVLSCGFLRFWQLARFQARAKQAYEQSASYACEATSAIRTVASLTREGDVWERYHQMILDQEAKSFRSVASSSMLYAASQSLMLLCMALSFWYGSRLIASNEYSLFQFFLCFSAIVFGAQSAGVIFSFAPDMGKAKHAAAEMKALIDRKPEIDTWSSEGAVLHSVRGEIEFRDVHFRYPTRPKQPVLSGLDLHVRPGQYVALVGPSGCGKSTTIAMLERFYNPLVGDVYVDGEKISSLNINSYRKRLALVPQEPTLYQGTVRENILLGADTSPEDVPEAAIVQACKDANIYDFILSLPEGFNTVVGNKGAMLSGGQKQRIAIARALLRDPKILLLDEATSALDSESEKIVQAALDKAAKGRTTIAVAHRLSTIQKADLICVFDQGRIVERGRHADLIAKKGRYFELVNLQSLAKT